MAIKFTTNDDLLENKRGEQLIPTVEDVFVILQKGFKNLINAYYASYYFGLVNYTTLALLPVANSQYSPRNLAEQAGINVEEDPDKLITIFDFASGKLELNPRFGYFTAKVSDTYWNTSLDNFTSILEPGTTEPKNGCEIGITCFFVDISQNNGTNRLGGSANWSQETSRWDIYPDNEVVVDNDTIIDIDGQIAASLNLHNGSAVGSVVQYKIPNITNVASGKGSAAFGLGTIASAEGQFVAGKFNEESNSSLFVLGNGTSDNSRSTAFEVTPQGVAKAYGTPQVNADLVNKGFADTHYATLLQDEAYLQLYAQAKESDGGGTVSIPLTDYDGTSAVSLQDTIPVYDAGKLVTNAPVNNYHAVNKQFAEDNYLSVLKTTPQQILSELTIGDGSQVSGERDLHVTGDLYVAGVSHIVDTETIQSQSNLIVVNDSRVPLLSVGGAGIISLTGNVNKPNEAYAVGYYNATADAVQIGLGTYVNGEFTFDVNSQGDSEGQNLATRSPSSQWTDGRIAVWDSTEYKFIDSGKTVSSFVDKVSTANKYQVYANYNGEQRMINYGRGISDGGALVQRNTDSTAQTTFQLNDTGTGTINVNNPIKPCHAVNKNYADSLYNELVQRIANLDDIKYGNSAPTPSTYGETDDLYIDLTTGFMYRCGGRYLDNDPVTGSEIYSYYWDKIPSAGVTIYEGYLINAQGTYAGQLAVTTGFAAGNTESRMWIWDDVKSDWNIIPKHYSGVALPTALGYVGDTFVNTTTQEVYTCTRPFYETLVSEWVLVTLDKKVFSNPVINAQFPDPTIWAGDDGYWYAMATTQNNTIRKSANLVDWIDTGVKPFSTTTWNLLASLTTDSSKAVMWAPNVIRVNGQYFLYCAVRTSVSDSVLVVCASTRPDGQFTYVKTLITANSLGVLDCIDPYVVSDFDGTRYMFFGSTYGIYRLTLTNDCLNYDSSTLTHVAGLTILQDSTRQKVFEGSMVYYRKGYWYLFCDSGSASTFNSYKLVVGRSATLTGTFVDKNGNLMTSGNASVVLSADIRSEFAQYNSPGHCSNIIVDQKGKTYIMYHAKTTNQTSWNRVAFLQEILWDANGWPYMKTRTDYDGYGSTGLLLNEVAPYLPNYTSPQINQLVEYTTPEDIIALF